MTDRERFLSHVDKSSPCWTWTANKDAKGYGRFRFHGRQSFHAHRASYVLFVGPIPDGSLVLHRCDNPSCVRPDHLFLGNYSDNLIDCIRKGRRTFPCGERNGYHKLTRQSVVEIRTHAETPTMVFAERYGVSRDAILRVKHGETWKGVTA